MQPTSLAKISSGGRGGALLAMAAGAGLFTVTVRSPLRAGFRCGRALWAVLPFALLWHLRLYFDWGEWGLLRREWLDPVTRLLGFDRVTFLEDQGMRWVLAALMGVPIGSAVGRPSVPPGRSTPGRPLDEDVDSPSERVSG